MAEKQCSVLEFDSEQSWLEVRKQYFTATMMADLATGGPSARERVYQDRRGLSRPFAGNAYTQWGHEREPLLVAWARERVDSRVEHNTWLYVSSVVEAERCAGAVYVADSVAVAGDGGPGMCLGV